MNLWLSDDTCNPVIGSKVMPKKSILAGSHIFLKQCKWGGDGKPKGDVKRDGKPQVKNVVRLYHNMLVIEKLMLNTLKNLPSSWQQ